MNGLDLLSVSVLDALNHITSTVAVLSCWWLSHQFARANPPGRALSVLCGIIGMSLLITMVQRANGAGFEALAVVSKTALSAFFLALILRNHEKGKDT